MADLQFNGDSKQIELKLFWEFSVQTSPISKNTYCDVINRGMSRDAKNHSHVVKQVKLPLIVNKWEQQAVLY